MGLFDDILSGRVDPRAAAGSLFQQVNPWLAQKMGPQPVEQVQEPEQDAMDRELQEFIKHMMELDPNDPEVQQAQQMGVNIANRQARLRGINGPLAVTGAQDAGLKALNPLRQFRQGLASQAMGLRNNRDISLRQLAENARQFDYSHNPSQDNGQAIGAIAGGLLGGGIGAFAGGPMGAGIGLSAGSQLGGGVGGLFGQGSNPTPSYGGPYYGGGSRGRSGSGG